jgi:FG-GAP-like repeat
VTAADVNHDGKTDIVYYDLDAGQVLVQLGNGNGTFQPATVAVSLGIFGTGFTTGDFNHDGILDIAAEASGVTEVLLGDGTGRFNLAGIFSEGTESGFAFVPNLLVGDFNGDGLQDIVAPDGFGETVSVLPGNGDGTFGTATLFQGGFADSAAVLNVPGFQPSIAMATEDTTVRILRNQTPSK